MADATTISVLIKARDQASAAFKNVETNAGKMAQGITRNRRAIGIGMLGIGAAVTGIGVVMAKTAATFDAKMREVNSLINLSQSEFQKLTDDTLDMASAVGVDAVEASEALYQAISAGVPKENVIDFMTIASKAAIAGVTDTETAVDGLTTVMNAFKMDIGEAQRVADIMFVAVKGGKTTFDELAGAMQYVAPIAAALNVPFEAIGAAAATMTKQGIPTKMAFTALRQTFVSLMKPTAEMENALNQVGFATGRALLEAHGLQGGLQLLTTGTNLTEAEMTKAFGSVEAFGAVLALTGQNAGEAAADLKKSYESAGAATEAFDIINEGTARQMAIMQARLKVVSIELGTILLPIVIAVTGFVADMAEKFRDFYKDHPTLVKWLGLIGIGLGALLVVFGGILLILPGLIAGFGALSVAMGPITAIVMGLTAVIYGAILIWQNWDEIISKVKKLLADTAQEYLGFARKALVALKAISDFTGGLFGASDKLQGAIDKLDSMSASMDDWSKETALANKKSAASWAKMEREMNDSAMAVMGDNEKMGDSTADLTRVIERELAAAAAAHNNLAGDTAESAQRQIETLSEIDAAYSKSLQQQSRDLRALGDEIREQEVLTANTQKFFAEQDILRRRERVAAFHAENADFERLRQDRQSSDVRSEAMRDAANERLVKSLSETSQLWSKYGTDNADVIKLWSKTTGENFDQISKKLDEWDTDLSDSQSVVDAFARGTGKNFFDMSADIKEALGDAKKEMKTWQEALASGIDSSALSAGHFQQIGSSDHALREAGRAMDRQKVGRDIQAWEGEIARAASRGNVPDYMYTQLQYQKDLFASLAPKKFASGGIVTQATLAMIGEAGPEAVVPLGRGGGMGTVNQFHFHGAVYGVEDLKEAVVEAVRDHAISGGFSGVFAEA